MKLVRVIAIVLALFLVGLTISMVYADDGKTTNFTGYMSVDGCKFWGVQTSNPTAEAVGDMFITSAGVLYIATATGTGSWSKVGAQ